jgi:predicted ribosomally synthesized peptide with SipW-like signal peptide
MKKSLLVGMLVFSLAALLVVGGTMAWFTDNAKVTNLFTAGTVEIEVNEHDFENITDWNPGDTTDKDVSVKSNGSKQTYVRVMLTPVWYDGENKADDVDAENVELILAEGWEDNWVESDGWYYYKDILNQGEETELLLDKVYLIGEDTGNEYQGLILRIEVEADAVQASNGAFKDAWGLDELPDGVEEWDDGEEASAEV